MTKTSAARRGESLAAYLGEAEEEKGLEPLYMEALHLVERLHRRLLDVIKDEFDRQGRSDINAVQGAGKTALILAMESNHRAIVDTLLEAGADSRLIDRYGNALLHYATRSNHADLVTWLLDGRADPSRGGRPGIVPRARRRPALRGRRHARARRPRRGSAWS